MKLPDLESPSKYAGLYIFELGDQVAVGYTADEIAVLLDSEKYADGKVYRIHRALPDGTIEIAGVSREVFRLEDGIFFYRQQANDARADFDGLCEQASKTTPPCRMKAQLARLEGAKYPHLTTIIFPAEFTHEVAAWLNEIGFEGGDFAEGGPSQVTGFYEAQSVVIDRQQLMPAGSDSRSAQEVLATTHLAIQRKPA